MRCLVVERLAVCCGLSEQPHPPSVLVYSGSVANLASREEPTGTSELWQAHLTSIYSDFELQFPIVQATWLSGR